VDRAIQVTVLPGRLVIDYEVSLAELTLTQELRSLIGSLPGTDRQAWLHAYGRETGPLNAKGLLVSVEDQATELHVDEFDLVVEEHPRYTFHFSAPLPRSGRLAVHDTNFATSEGTSRLAVRGRNVQIRGDDLPGDVNQIAAEPLWRLSNEQERRTREFGVEFEAATNPGEITRPAPGPAGNTMPRARGANALTRLLDRDPGGSKALLLLAALLLGSAHALQPGHGKALVTATVVTGQGDWFQGALLAIVSTLTHTGSVAIVAAVIWAAGSVEFYAIDTVLARSAGFVIAGLGAWRLGRLMGGHSEHVDLDKSRGDEPSVALRLSGRSVVSLGIAAGLVPCWEAVGLMVLAAAIGRLGLGLVLVLAFSLGAGTVLVGVSWAAAKATNLLHPERMGSAWVRRLGMTSSLILVIAGGYLLWT
jgi:ABC-type nickel/cobalt efflux system permease component RcnA